MNKPLYYLLVAQFLSAFADNAILFTIIALVMQATELATWYVPALQGVFLIAFVVLAPWVGGWADSHPKSQVLITANVIKAIGVGLLLLQSEPLIAYAVVGIGAAIYSPAKYGILPELTQYDGIVKANGWIEAATILAILLGMIIGAKVADYSIQWALIGGLLLFIASILVTLCIPTQASRTKQTGIKIIIFTQQFRQFFSSSRACFSLLSASLFWASAAVIRVIIITWAPLVLMQQNASEVAELTLFLAIGIIIGSALAPRLIPLHRLARASIPSFAMGLFIIAMGFADNLWSAQVMLLAIGIAGGLLIVPINATLQTLGQQSIGSGSAIAVQGFLQNVAMLIAVSCYAFVASVFVDDVIDSKKLTPTAADLITRTFTEYAFLVLGILVLLTTTFIALKRIKENKE